MNNLPPDYNVTVTLDGSTDEIVSLNAATPFIIQLITSQGVLVGNNLLLPAYPTSGPLGYYLRGDGQWASLSYSAIAGVPTLATTASSGLIPALNSASGSGAQTTVWLRGDNTFASLPQVAYTNAPFTVPSIGSTVTMTVYSAGWATVGGDIYYSDGTHRGFMDITGTANGGATITLKNTGNANAGDVVASGSIIRLQGPAVATATVSGLVPTPPNTTNTFFRGDATFTAIPSGAAATLGLVPSTDIQVFATPGAGTWTKPTVGTPKVTEVICIGGGGGGGSGAYCVLNTTAATGGAGGAGGNYSTFKIATSLLGATVALNVGAGCAGGTSKTSGAPVAGIAGTAPVAATNDSWFGASITTALCYASAGASGGGGLASTVAATGGVAVGMGYFGGGGGASGSGNAAGVAATNGNNRVGASGGGGGGSFAAASAAAQVGGAGAASPNGVGGGAAGAIHAIGTAGSGSPLATYLPGDGGGGGGSTITNAGPLTGGAGGVYGGGGGGGGAAVTLYTGSGAGGAGANGVVVVITYF